MIENKKRPESCILKLVFNYLNKAGVRYAVLRNFEALPDSVNGGDLDLMIHPDDTISALELVHEAIKDAGGTAIGVTRSPGFRQILAFGRDPMAESEWWGLCLDIFDEVLYFGVVPLISDSIWIDGCEKIRDISVLRPELAAVLGVLKEVLYNGIVAPRYRDQAMEAFKLSSNYISRWLMPLGDTGITKLSTIIINNPDREHAAIEVRKLRRYLLLKAIFDSPVRLLTKFSAFIWSRVSRVWSPGGLVIAVLGTDGAGKSTIISAIAPTLSAATHGSVVFKHLRPGLLPPLARIRGQQPEQVGPVTNPHASMPSGFLGSLIRLVYATIDYIFGYWVLVWPKIAKVPSAVVVFDRYAYDLMIDPKRFRIGLPTKLISWFCLFVPKPDIILCLYASASLVVLRKQELPLEEVVRQTSALREFALSNSRAVLISTEGTVDETRDRVLLAVRRYCVRRTGIGL